VCDSSSRVYSGVQPEMDGDMLRLVPGLGKGELHLHVARELVFPLSPDRLGALLILVVRHLCGPVVEVVLCIEEFVQLASSQSINQPTN